MTWDQMMKDPRNQKIYSARKIARAEGRRLPKYFTSSMKPSDADVGREKIISMLHGVIAALEDLRF